MLRAATAQVRSDTTRLGKAKHGDGIGRRCIEAAEVRDATIRLGDEKMCFG